MTDGILNKFLARGTTAARLAFTPSPPTPGAGPSHGYVWLDTDLFLPFFWDGLGWIAGSAGMIVYFKPGAGTANDTILSIPAVFGFTLLATLPHANAICTTGPTGTVVYDIQKNGVSIGSITFTVSATSGTFTFAADVDIDENDVLTVVAPVDIKGIVGLNFALYAIRQ